MLKRNEIATFPIYLKVEHCAAQVGPGNTIQPGVVKESATSEKFSLSTLHDPFNGEDSIEADSFEDLRSCLKHAYKLWCKESDRHRGYNDPSPEDGDIIMSDTRLQLTSVDPGRVVNEQNWHEALAVITCRQMQLNGCGSKFPGMTRFATFTASFTCPRRV